MAHEHRGVFNAPVDTTGGLPRGLVESESPEHSLLPEVPERGQAFPSSAEFTASDRQTARRGLWEATGYVAPIVGGADSTHKPDEDNPEEIKRNLIEANRRAQEASDRLKYLRGRLSKEQLREWEEFSELMDKLREKDPEKAKLIEQTIQLLIQDYVRKNTRENS